jgi:hypothetical protein
MTDREDVLVRTIKAYREQQSEAAKHIKEAKAELAKLAPHKVGEIVKWVVKGRQKRVGGTIWHPKYEQQPDKEVVAVLTKVEAEVDSVYKLCLHYHYEFKPLKKDGGIGHNSVYPRGTELEWTGEIYESYKD